MIATMKPMAAMALFGIPIFIGLVVLIGVGISEIVGGIVLVVLSAKKTGNKVKKVFAIIGSALVIILGAASATPGTVIIVVIVESIVDEKITEIRYEKSLERLVNLDDIEQVRSELERGVNPNKRVKSTPLRQAVFNNNYEMAKLLLDYGAKPSDLSLYYACGNIERCEIALLLLEYGADPNQEYRERDYYDNGYTALFQAVLSSNADAQLIEPLLEHGADINHISDRGETVLDIMYRHNADDYSDFQKRARNKIIDCLIENGAKTVKELEKED